MPHSEKTTGVVPGGPLAQLLAKTRRHERRDLLAALQTTNEKRRRKLERRFLRSLERRGVAP